MWPATAPRHFHQVRRQMLLGQPWPLTCTFQAMKQAVTSAARRLLATCSPTASASLSARCLVWKATSRRRRTCAGRDSTVAGTCLTVWSHIHSNTASSAGGRLIGTFYVPPLLVAASRWIDASGFMHLPQQLLSVPDNTNASCRSSWLSCSAAAPVQLPARLHLMLCDAAPSKPRSCSSLARHGASDAAEHG